MDLKLVEREKLEQLGQLEATVSNLSITLDQAVEELDACKRELEAVRDELLQEFLDEELPPRNLGYVVNRELDGEVVVNVMALVGGEIELQKLSLSTGWTDLSKLPLIYLLNYLGKGTPWQS